MLRIRSSWSFSIVLTPSRMVVVRDSNRPRPLAIFQSATTPEPPPSTEKIESGSTGTVQMHPCRVPNAQASVQQEALGRRSLGCWG